jgi:hypothetical protein
MDPTEDTPDATDDMQRADRANGEPAATDATGPTTRPGGDGRGTSAGRPRVEPPGRDTATGTDPDARYDHAGYEDKSLGQAVAQDRDLAERLLSETGGDEVEAERRFQEESAGAPALERQHRGDTG